MSWKSIHKPTAPGIRLVLPNSRTRLPRRTRLHQRLLETVFPHIGRKTRPWPDSGNAPIPGLKLRGAFHHNKGYDYFRETDGRILLGGGRNLDLEGETTTEQDINPTIYDYLRTLLHETIFARPQPAIDHIWTGTMGIGQTKASIDYRV